MVELNQHKENNMNNNDTVNHLGPREPTCNWCEIGTVRYTGRWAFAPYACVPTHTQWQWNERQTVLGYCGLNYATLAEATK